MPQIVRFASAAAARSFFMASSLARAVALLLLA
jgi:hypothetical protein